MKTMFHLFLVILSLITANRLYAQEDKAKADPAFYRLDFVVKEVESGKVTNSRAYSSMISAADGKGSIRVGNRVPVPTQPLQGGFPAGVTYHDIGINLDFSYPKELTDRLALQISADITSISAPPETAGGHPVTRQNRWTSYVVVSLRKPTTIFTSDDPASKRQLQLELTATPIK